MDPAGIVVLSIVAWLLFASTYLAKRINQRNKKQ